MPTSNKKRLLLDIDGVLTNGWTEFVADLMMRHCGLQMDITKWFKAQDLPAASRVQVLAMMAGPDVCYNFEPTAGAVDAVKRLRKLGHEVHFVTSMWDSPTWTYDRNRWLRKHGFAKNAPSGVTYERDKHISFGHVFVDDKPKNVTAWQNAWPDGLGIVWRQPWNHDYTGPCPRFNNWDRLIELVEEIR